MTDLSFINLQMMRQCYYKQSLVLFHANNLCDYYNFGYNISTQEDNNQTEIQRLSSRFLCAHLS